MHLWIMIHKRIQTQFQSVIFVLHVDDKAVVNLFHEIILCNIRFYTEHYKFLPSPAYEFLPSFLRKFLHLL